MAAADSEAVCVSGKLTLRVAALEHVSVAAAVVVSESDGVAVTDTDSVVNDVMLALGDGVEEVVAE